jgi:hypothetical protein
MMTTYNHFWTVVQSFQTLVSAFVSLIAVLGAILGILLKARIDKKAVERTRRDDRRATALSMYSLIRMETAFPETSVLQIPTDGDVFTMLSNEGNAAIGINSYIDYFTKFVSTLSGFPKPICDRAHFLAWVSARTALAMAAVCNARQGEREAMARRYAPDVRTVLIAGIVVLDDLAHELVCYENSPEQYEEKWVDTRTKYTSEQELRDPEPKETEVRGIRSRGFDMKVLKRRVWEIKLRPSAGLRDAADISRSGRPWLAVLLKDVDERVRNLSPDRKEVNNALGEIFHRCKGLPEDSPTRQAMERLVVTIWKGGEDKIDVEDLSNLDIESLGLINDLSKQAARSWRL